MHPLCLLIDGSSLLFRAFHALPPLHNAAGEPTGALVGFFNLLSKVLLREQPQSMAIVFDAPEKTIRHSWYPAYKAQRGQMPDALAVQIAPLLEMIQALGIPLIIQPGIEADDLLGSLALTLSEKDRPSSDHPIMIMSSDKDFAQLLAPSCMPGLLLLQASGERLDRDGIWNKFGVWPEQIVDYLSLVGDTVDNIPGVPQVGPKTAAKWLAQYQDLDNLLSKADEIRGAVGVSLRKTRDWLIQARRLVTIQCDLPSVATYTWRDLQRQPLNVPLLRQQWTRYELKQYLKQLPQEDHPLSLSFESLLPPLLSPTPTLEPSRPEQGLDNNDYRATIDAPIMPILRSMEERGFLIDKAELQEQDTLLRKKIAQLEEQIYAEINQALGENTASSPVNLHSAKQLRTLLFEQLGWPIIEKTPGGEASTGEAALSVLSKTYPLAQWILKHRSLSKLQSTYTGGLANLINPSTHRLHTTFTIEKTMTGRLSSLRPNLQNIPRRGEDGIAIRRAFIAPPGYTLLSLDYAHIELRLMAHFSQDPTLLSAFAQDMDVHALTAAHLFGLPIEQISSAQRQIAKTINFGLIYGMSAFGVSQQLDLPLAEAKAFMETYFQTYPGIQRCMDETRALAREQGYVETLFHRKIPTADILSPSFPRRQAAERAAINAPLQGSAADLIKKAMYETVSYAQSLPAQDQARLILQVHDELIFEVPNDALPLVAPTLQHIMENIAPLRVPLKVHRAQGPNWDSLD